jgi:hypothetical protein
MAASDRTYKCLNPVGIQMPVLTFPLASRLDKLDSKNVHICICGEPDITIPLEKILKTNYPKVNWTIKKTYGIDPRRLSAEEMKSVDAVVLGVCW